MTLDESQGRELGKALFDIGKVVFAIAVVTPMVTSGGKAWLAAAIGGVWVVILFAVATRLVKKKDDTDETKEESLP